jgi:hypothetical protein
LIERNTSFTGHGKLPSPAMFAVYLGSVMVSMYQRLQVFLPTSTGPAMGRPAASTIGLLGQ